MALGSFLIDNKPGIQILLVTVATILFVLYFKHFYNWDWWFHLIYDVPAGIVVFYYLSEVLFFIIERKPLNDWGYHLILLIPIIAVPLGREFIGTNVSGHLTDVTIVGFAHTLFSDHMLILKILFWIPFPVVLISRFLYLNNGENWQAYWALIIAGIFVAIAFVVEKAFLN